MTSGPVLLFFVSADIRRTWKRPRHSSDRETHFVADTLGVEESSGRGRGSSSNNSNTCLLSVLRWQGCFHLRPAEACLMWGCACAVPVLSPAGMPRALQTSIGLGCVLFVLAKRKKQKHGLSSATPLTFDLAVFAAGNIPRCFLFVCPTAESYGVPANIDFWHVSEQLSGRGCGGLQGVGAVGDTTWAKSSHNQNPR